MVDKISGGASSAASQRLQELAQSNRLRNTSVLTAVQQSDKQTTNARSAVQVFAVPQTNQSGTASGTAKLPRGSLVDVLA